VSSSPSRTALLLGFATIYVVWGSTYLAIRFAIETLPPFLMAGMRFVVAGSVLLTWAWLRGDRGWTFRHWRAGLVVGGLLLLGGNGGVVWAEQRIASGLAALLVATVPLWVVVLDSLGVGGTRRRPKPAVLAGVAGGLAGVALLIGPGSLMGVERVDLLGAGVVIAASFAWALGSVYTRRAGLPESPAAATGMEMLSGGVLLLLVSLLAGEPGRVVWGAVSLKSLWALGYLIVFGALLAFTAYVWLLRVADTAKVATYAYVNPVVALVLGWGMAGEELSARTLLAAAVILASVALIVTFRRPVRVARDPEPEELEAAPPSPSRRRVA
jgi:drug/metabolite transporter (DMT)-like permease